MHGIRIRAPITFPSNEKHGEESPLYIKPRSKVRRAGPSFSLERSSLSTWGFGPSPVVYRPRETAFFAVKSPRSRVRSFSPFAPSVGFTFGLALSRPRHPPLPPSFSRSCSLFPAALFPWPPKRNECATALRCLLSATSPSEVARERRGSREVPRPYVMARPACLERERGSHT